MHFSSRFVPRTGVRLLLTTWVLLLATLVFALEVNVLSSPPEWVSGDSARLEVLTDGDASAVRIFLEGANGLTDITDAFTASAGRLEGVVHNLALGANRVVASSPTGSVTLELTNHPSSGPIFSGPQQEMFLCSTEKHRSDAALGDPIDDDCTIPTEVDFMYWSISANSFQPYTAETDTADVAEVSEGVPFIVRWERGTINRFIYSIAMLSPAAQDSNTVDTSGWNKRLLMAFQGGVGIGHYQGRPANGYMLNKEALANGYAVAYSTALRTSTHYNMILGNETAIMLKDHFVTHYGNPDYTVSTGGSGGGIQQYLYSQNTPTLLDAMIPQYSYPDMVTQTIHVGDCELLERWIDAKAVNDPTGKWAVWSNRTWLQGMNAIDHLPNKYFGGLPGLTECINGWRGLSPLVLNPHFGEADGMTMEQFLETEWTHFGDAVNVYGTREDGFARNTWDNVGVQYGLQALVDGHITPAEFLDLNANVGSWKDQAEMVQEGCPFLSDLCADPNEFDVWSARNMNLSPNGFTPAPRKEADPGAIRAVRESGMFFRGDVLDIPTIDWRPYLEHELDMHNVVQSFSARQRIINGGGNVENQVIWFTDVKEGEPKFDHTFLALATIDEWMANITANPELSVAENKPAMAVDACFDYQGELIYAGNDAWNGILDDGPKGPCAEHFEVYNNSRIVAGGPITGDVFKCHLQSVDQAIERGLYGDWQPNPYEVHRLNEIFPTGVCDYTLGEGGMDH